MSEKMWRTSSYSNLCDCVEVAPGSQRTWVRDSKNPGVVLSVTGEDWADLIRAVRRAGTPATSSRAGFRWRSWIVAGAAAWMVPSAAILAGAWWHEQRDRKRAHRRVMALRWARAREAALRWALTEVERTRAELARRQEEDHMRALVAQMPETVSMGDYRGYN